MKLEPVAVIRGDLQYKEHCSAVVALVNEYRTDPMGGNLDVLNSESEALLIKGLQEHSTTLVLLAIFETKIIGTAVCFWGFSTFQAKTLLNIHDLIVSRKFRGNGVGTLLLKYASEEAHLRNCCKLTLEVRSDNNRAQHLYRSMSFKPCENPMEFWIRQL